LGEYNQKKLVSVEAAKLDNVTDNSETSDTDLNHGQIDELCNYLREILASKVTVVRETKRLLNTPALIVDHESGSHRRMMRMVDPTRMPELPKQQLEINVKHPIIKKLYAQRNAHPNIAKEVAVQLFDNALVAAGLLDDSRGMLQRLNKILEKALESAEDLPSPPESVNETKKEDATVIN